MKTKLIWVLALIIACINVYGQEKTDSLMHVTIDKDGVMRINNEAKDKGTLTRRDREYYLFTNARIIEVKSPQETKVYKGENGIFYKVADHTIVDIKDFLTRTDGKFCLGVKDGYTSSKFAIKVPDKDAKTNFFICRSSCYQLDYDIDIRADVNDSLKLEIKLNDTITLRKTDTLCLNLKDYKYSVLKDVKVNDVSVDSSFGRDAINANDIWKTDTVSVELTPDRFNKDYNTVSVTYLSFDDNGLLNKENTQSFVVSVANNDVLLIVDYVLIFLVVLSVLFCGLIYKSVHQRHKKRHNKKDVKEDNVIASSEKKSAENGLQLNVLKQLKKMVTDIKRIIAGKDGETNKLSEQVEDLSTQKNSARFDDSLKRELAAKEERIKDLEKIISEQQECLDRKNERIATLDGYIEEKNKSLKDDKEKLDAIRSELSKLNQRLNEEESKHNMELESLRKSYSQKIDIREEEHIRQVDEIKKEYSVLINEKNAEIADLRRLIDSDRVQVRSFYTRNIEKVVTAMSVIKEGCDSDSMVFAIIDTLTGENSVNGFGEFENLCREILESDRTLEELTLNLKDALLKELSYEKSWCNSLARLYAYSKVDDLGEIFGYYREYREDFRVAFKSMIDLAEKLGIEDIRVPELFTEAYDRKLYDFRNTNLVLPELFPNYGTLLSPLKIYDILKVGYTCGEKTIKAMVVYHPEH